MDALDENSPRGRGVFTASAKVKGRQFGSPLAERARDAQGQIRQQASSNFVKTTEPGSILSRGRSMEGSASDSGGSPVPKLAKWHSSSVTLADVLDGLSSPSTKEDQESGAYASSSATVADFPSPNFENSRNKRRETADFSEINALLDDSTASEMDLPPTTATAVASYPKARNRSNEKPGRDKSNGNPAAGRLGVPPPAVMPPLEKPSRASKATGVSVAGSGRNVSGGLVSAKPKSPARRPRRTIRLDPSRTRAEYWEDNVPPTSEEPTQQHKNDRQPAFESLRSAAADNLAAADSLAAGDNDGGGVTGDVGNLFASLSVEGNPTSAAGADRRNSSSNDRSSSSEKGGGQHGDSDDTADEVREAGSMNMENFVADIEAGKATKGRKVNSRRLTADKLCVDSLLESLDDSVSISSPGVDDPDEASDMMTIMAKRRRSSRRLTAEKLDIDSLLDSSSSSLGAVDSRESLVDDGSASVAKAGVQNEEKRTAKTATREEGDEGSCSGGRGDEDSLSIAGDDDKLGHDGPGRDRVEETVVGMDDVLADFAASRREKRGASKRSNTRSSTRRMTADRFELEALLGALGDSPSPPAAIAKASSGNFPPTCSEAGDGIRRSQVEAGADGGLGVVSSESDMLPRGPGGAPEREAAENGEASHHTASGASAERKTKSKRRETADLESLQDLLQSPKVAQPSESENEDDAFGKDETDKQSPAFAVVGDHADGENVTANFTAFYEAMLSGDAESPSCPSVAGGRGGSRGGSESSLVRDAAQPSPVGGVSISRSGYFSTTSNDNDQESNYAPSSTGRVTCQKLFANASFSSTPETSSVPRTERFPVLYGSAAEERRSNNNNRRESRVTAGTGSVLGLFDSFTAGDGGNKRESGATGERSSVLGSLDDSVTDGAAAASSSTALEDLDRSGSGRHSRTGRRGSGETADIGPMLGLFESTPSPSGGLDQSLADGSALRFKALARMFHGGSSASKAADSSRRLTCDRADFDDIIGDLASSASPTTNDGDGGSSRSDGLSTPGQGNLSDVSSPSSSRSPITMTTKQDSPSEQDSIPAEMGKFSSTEDLLSTAVTKKKNTKKGKERERDSRRATASPGAIDMLMDDLGLDDDIGGCEDDVGGERSDDDGVDGVSDVDDGDGAVEERMEVEPDVDTGAGVASGTDGDSSVASSCLTTPSPPVSRRTRSKSPISGKKVEAVNVASLSPRVAVKKRPSLAVSPDEKSSASKPSAPGSSARPPLKSCFSSKKRARNITTAADHRATTATAFSSPETRIGVYTATSNLQANNNRSISVPGGYPPSNHGPSVGGGGGTVVGDGDTLKGVQETPARGTLTPGVGVETPRRVMFGAPMAAEFNHTSPSNKLTPMPSRDAKSLFPLEEKEEAATDEDEDTAANSAQLAEWENYEASIEEGDAFDSFDSVNGTSTWDASASPAAAADGGGGRGRGGGRGSSESGPSSARAGKGGKKDRALPSKSSPSPSRSRRRESLAPKSPLRRSIAEYSEDVQTVGDSSVLHFPYEDDSDVEDTAANRAIRRNIAVLNASMSVPAPLPAGGGANGGSSCAGSSPSLPVGSVGDAMNQSFSINTRDIHLLADSDSSMEITGSYGVPIAHPSAAAAVDASHTSGDDSDGGGNCGGGGGGASGTRLEANRPTAGLCDDGAGDSDIEVDGEGDSREDINDSSELAYTFNVSSIRDAVSPGVRSRRRSSCESLLDVMSEVGEYAAEVMSQEALITAEAVQGDEQDGANDRGDEGGDEAPGGDDTQELLLLSPIPVVDASRADASSPSHPGDEVVRDRQASPSMAEESGNSDGRSVGCEGKKIASAEKQEEGRPISAGPVWGSRFAQVDGDRLPTVLEETSPDGMASRSGNYSRTILHRSRDSAMLVSPSSAAAAPLNKKRKSTDNDDDTIDLADFADEFEWQASALGSSPASPRATATATATLTSTSTRAAVSSSEERQRLEEGRKSVRVGVFGGVGVVNGGSNSKRQSTDDTVELSAFLVQFGRDEGGRRVDNVQGSNHHHQTRGELQQKKSGGTSSSLWKRRRDSATRQSSGSAAADLPDALNNFYENDVMLGDCVAQDTAFEKTPAACEEGIAEQPGPAELPPGRGRQSLGKVSKGGRRRSSCTDVEMEIDDEGDEAEEMDWSSEGTKPIEGCSSSSATVNSKSNSDEKYSASMATFPSVAEDYSSALPEKEVESVVDMENPITGVPVPIVSGGSVDFAAVEELENGTMGPEIIEDRGGVPPAAETEPGNVKSVSSTPNLTSSDNAHMVSLSAEAAIAAPASSVVDKNSGAPRPPLHRRASSSSMLRGGKGNASSTAEGGFGVGQHGRRSTLQAMMGRKRRASIDTVGDGGGGISSGERKVGPAEGVVGVGTRRDKEKEESSVSSLRRRLSQSSVGAVEGSTPRGDIYGGGSGGGGGLDAMKVNDVEEVNGGGGVGLEVDYQVQDATDLFPGKAGYAGDGGEDVDVDEDDEVPPLAMTIEDLLKFVDPNTADEGYQAAIMGTVVISPGDGHALSKENVKHLPASLTRAMADAVVAAAVEMEDKVSASEEHASASAEAAWNFHTDAPILAQIDSVVAGAASAAQNNAGMPLKVRELGQQIKSGLERELVACELLVQERITTEAEKALSRVSISSEACAKREAEIDQLLRELECAEGVVSTEEARADTMSRLAKGGLEVLEEKSKALDLEGEIEALELKVQAVAARKASFVEGKAREEEKAKAAEKRSGSVLRLMELENRALALEKEALIFKDKFDVQLGMKLWCLPVTILTDRIVVAFAAPHDWRTKHELKFSLGERSSVKKVTTSVVRDATEKKLGVCKGGMVAVGDRESASGRLSRLFFESDCGLFSTGSSAGAAVTSLNGVQTLADVRNALQNVDWHIGRAYSLLREVYQLEKRHACTVVEVSDESAEGACSSIATCCFEVVSWRSRVKLRLRFRVSTLFACCIGSPKVEVEIGNLGASAVEDAIVKTGGDRSSLLSLTRAVQAAVAAIDG